MKGKVHVAGAGVVSAIGMSVTENLHSFEHHRSGIAPLSLFPSVHRHILPVGEVKSTNNDLAARLGCTEKLPRTALLGMLAAREAVQQAGVDLRAWRTGLISATTVGGMDRTENFFEDFLVDQNAGDLQDVKYHPCGAVTDLIADDLGIDHYVSTVNTACSSSVNAIGFGARLIQAGALDVVVAGGADALTRFTVNGFNSLMILDREPCRPFDATRSGLNLGEGAGFVVLVSERVLMRDALTALATVDGFGNTNDAFHQTASSPEGRGSYAAMHTALTASGLMPTDIDYINLHGTGTVNNDLSEGTAVSRLFGQTLPAMSSTKSFTGHTLGASGGMEAVFSVMALVHQCVLPNLRFQSPMPELGIVPQQQFRSAKISHAMSNSFGFGGNCSSIVFSRP